MDEFGLEGLISLSLPILYVFDSILGSITFPIKPRIFLSTS